MADTHLKSRMRNRYKSHIKNFYFLSNDDLVKQSNIIFFRSLIFILLFEVMCIASLYIFSILVFAGDQLFREFLFEHVKQSSLLIALSVALGISLFIRNIIYKSFLISHKRMVKSQAKIDKIIKLSTDFPELGSVVKERIKTNGYLSELDYSCLGVEAVYHDLYKKKLI